MNTFFLSELPDHLQNRETKKKEHPFIVSDKGVLSYGEFEALVEKTGKWAASIGVRKNDRCAIISESSEQFIILIFALWYNGAIPVPLNTRLLESEIGEQADECRARFIFADRTYRHLTSKRCILFPPEEYTESEKGPEANNSGGSTALILFTSGSSGSSKGVMLTFNNLIWSIKGTDSLVIHSAADRWLASLPFYHIGGLLIPLRAYVSNCTVIIPESLRAEGLLSAIKKHRPTLLSLVSTSFRQILQTGLTPWPELRNLFLGGGPIDESLSSQSIAGRWPVIKVYGSTETCSMVTAININDHPGHAASAGKAIQESKVFIRDENGIQLKAGEPGEIVISGPTVMAGYFEKEQLTSEKLKGTDYYTGDLGHLDEEGFLFIEMRRTDLIVSGGENINPMEVEGVITSYPGIKEVCVFPMRDEHWGQIAAAVIVSEGNLAADENDIALFIRNKLASYKVPKKFFFADELPRTPLGKIRRDDIAKMYNG